MSDKLKTCPWCKGEAKITRTKWVFSKNQIREAFAAGCDNDSKKECPGRLCFCRVYDTEAEAIAAWNTRADDAQIAANDNLPAETDISADGHDRNDTETVDSRERLEADVREWCATFPTWNHAKEFRETVFSWFDRQAAITTHEVSDSYEHVAERQSDRIFELHNKLADALEQVDSLTAECAELKTKLESCGKVPDLDGHEKQKLMESGDSREQLEADICDWLTHDLQGNPLYEAFADSVEPGSMPEIRRWLDRQAAITKRKCQIEIDAVTCDRDYFRKHVRQMNELIDKLTAERDELKAELAECEYELAKCEHDWGELLDEKYRLKAERDELRGKLAEKQHVCDVQRDSFLKLERENRELQDVCGELERTLENLRGD